MVEIPYIAGVAALIGDPARANMLGALKNDGAVSATELARIAGVAPSTASEHLARLVAGRLVAVQRQGRHRHYRLADAAVADAIEALETLAARAAPRRPRADPRWTAIRAARTCYDHLAGTLGVRLTWAMVERGLLSRTGDGFALGPGGAAAFARLGIDLDALCAGRRHLMRSCPDWSEPRPHLGGALGAALLSRLVALGWLRREPGSRTIRVTPRGHAGLCDQFGIAG